MNKKIMLLGTSIAILLSACGSSNIKGSELYADGKYESYVKAYKYFEGVLKKDPGNGEAEEQLKTIKKQFIELSKKIIEEKYMALEPIEAEKYLNKALKMDPNDEELLKVKDMIIKAAEDQRNINEFTDYLEKTYKTFNTDYQQFSDILTKVNTGQGNQAEIINFINAEYPKIVELRKGVDQHTYGYVTNGYTELADINASVFNYLLSVENEFNTVISKSNDGEIYKLSELNNDLVYYNAAGINEQFLQIQKNFTTFLSEVDQDEKRIYNVKNTLNFSKNNDDGDNVVVEGDDEENDENEN